MTTPLKPASPQGGTLSAKVAEYIDRTGMAQEEFARRIGYAPSSFRGYMSGKYHLVAHSETIINAAIESYMASHPIGAVRELGGELFETGNVRLIRETFAKLLARPRAFMIYAPPGSQKSFVLEREIHALNLREIGRQDSVDRAFYVYAREGITKGEMVKRIAVACGSRANGTIDRVLNGIRADYTGKRVVLVIDEAQHMSLECFEVIRELLDRDPFFSLLFSGSHDLFLKFERASATLEQWNSRIAQKVRLPGCTREEARAIVEREVGSILVAHSKGSAYEKAVETFIKRATVVDAYVPVAPGQQKATYINIRTLCNALDDLQSQYAATQKENAA